MAPTLKLISGASVGNPQTLDLSPYLNLQDGTDLDPQDPSFSQKTISHSLLREGGVLSLEDMANKELLYPLSLNAPTASALAQLIIQINQILTSAGATFSWQDDGMSQPTIFDGISGDFAIKYSYRKASSPAHWCDGDLKLYTMPLGHTTGPQIYATASGVGPLLMVSPYASGGALAIGASTQAGVAGFGGRPAQASSPNVFYWGAPSLAGDAPALLRLAYVGASVIGGTGNASQTLAVAAVSLLPDQNYQPWLNPGNNSGWTTRSGASSVGPSLLTLAQTTPSATNLLTAAIANTSSPVPVTWGGPHRLFAFARASGTWGKLSTQVNSYVSMPTAASIGPPGPNFALYDLGTLSIRPSQAANQFLALGGAIPSVAGVGANAALDVAGLIMLPDSATWFAGASAFANPNTQGIGGNVIYVDDILQDQFIDVFSLASAPRPWNEPIRVTPWTRGLVPRPDPKNGVPILALLAVGASGMAWPYPPMSAVVEALPRTRYVLP
jgi:hypothetical protein